MPPSATEPKRLTDVLVHEQDHYLSRRYLDVENGEALELGAVVARVAATGRLVELDPGGAGGAEVAYGVLIDETLPNPTVAVTPSYCLERNCVVQADNLVWPAGIQAGEKATAIDQLEERGIRVRTGA